MTGHGDSSDDADNDFQRCVVTIIKWKMCLMINEKQKQLFKNSFSLCRGIKRGAQPFF